MSIQSKTEALMNDYRTGVISRDDLNEMNDCCDGLNRQELAALQKVLAIVEAEDGGVKQQEVESIKLLELVRRKVDGPVLIRGEYDRSSKRYSLSYYGDMNREVFVKKGTKLFVGFTY